MHKHSGEHSCTSSTFPLAIRNGTCFLRRNSPCRGRSFAYQRLNYNKKRTLRVFNLFLISHPLPFVAVVICSILFVCQFVCLSIRLFVNLFVCQFVCLSSFVYFFCLFGKVADHLEPYYHNHTTNSSVSDDFLFFTNTTTPVPDIDDTYAKFKVSSK